MKRHVHVFFFCLFLYHISRILAALTDQDLHLPDKESQFEERSKPFLELFIFHVLQYILTILKCIIQITYVYLKNYISFY